MSDLDVLIIGGYSLGDSSAGGSQIRDNIRLIYGKHLASINFIKQLVKNKANLELAEQTFIQENKSRLVSRSLNTIYLFDFLSKNNISVKAINYFLLEQNKFKELISLKPKVVVISTTFIYNPEEIKVISEGIRASSPESIIITGGIKILKSYKKLILLNEGYFNGFDSEQMKKQNFFFEEDVDKISDIFVVEENGESTLLKLIEKIINKEDFKNVPNIAFRDNKNLVFTKKSPEQYTFQNYIVSWDKIPKDIIGQEIPIRAGIGCPFKCAFCDFTGLHKVKIRSIENVIEELKLIQSTFPGIPVFFTDDNLFITKKRTKQLAEAIVKNNLRFPWRAFFRTDAISEDNVEILAKSGCLVAYLGVESGDNRILKNMDKKTTREQNLQAVKLLNQNGINTISTLIVGFPGETKETVTNSIDLLNSYPDLDGTINKYYPFVFLLFPLSPIASPDNRKKFSITGGYEKWKHSSMSINEAREQFARLFKEVEVPTVAYLEYIDPQIPIDVLKKISKKRDDIVKNGINYIDKNNVLKVYEKFNPLFT